MIGVGVPVTIQRVSTNGLTSINFEPNAPVTLGL
jgi:hypothetical protein